MADRRLHEALSGRRLTRKQYEQQLPLLQDRLLDAQVRLRDARSHAAVMIVTGIPGAGRSEVVNELLAWLDPKLVTVFGFGRRNDVERERPVLWRYWQTLPARGRSAILHGGWYQEALLAAAGLIATHSPDTPGRDLERIRQLEEMLVRDGVALCKVHLHVAPGTQQKRLEKLAADKTTRWRVTAEDRWLARHYARVERAFERTLAATDTPLAPWAVIDGSDREHRALEVGRRLLAALSRRPPAGRAAARWRACPIAALRRPLPSRAPSPSLDDAGYDQELERLQGRLALLSRRKRFARHAVVVVFEGMDAAGKGGAIRRITAALDARQFRVVPVSAPTPDELSHPYLWRFWRQLPPRGSYTIFDRSWYGRVLVERVRGFARPPDWRRAYAEINEFERQLHEHRVIVAKFWLSVGKGEQLERFAERDRDPLKRFKVDPEDWANRKLWNPYQAAAREMIARTSTPRRRGSWCRPMTSATPGSRSCAGWLARIEAALG